MVLFGIFYVVFNSSYRINLRLCLQVLSFLSVLILLLYFSWETIAGTHSGKRIMSALNTPLRSWVYLDGSTALRILNQVVAINVFLDNPLGIGSGQFQVYYSDYVGTLFDQVKNRGEVAKALAGGTVNPQSIFMRLLVEGGIIAGLIVLITALSLLFKCSKLSKFSLFLIAFITVSGMQTASYGFAHIYVALIFLLGDKKFGGYMA